MTHPSTSSSPLFLRESEVRRGIELLFLAQREIAAASDAMLEREGLGRAHQRALYFIARKPGLAISELKTLLGVTKQSLARVLEELERRTLLERRPGLRDRRQVLLHPTKQGAALEAELFAALRARMAEAYSSAGPEAVGHFWDVLERLLPEDLRRKAAELALRDR
ncbi:MAG: MarR family winged helix-turn-helix transcriptional regulator [Parasphingopyxis sp.]